MALRILSWITLMLIPPAQADWMAASVSDKPETLLYVSPAGNDSWSGGFAEPTNPGGDGPLSSLMGARDRIRVLRQSGRVRGPLRVLLREGIYRLESPVTFFPEDTGTQDAPVIFEAYPNEHPQLSGGRRITNWRKEGNRWISHVPQVTNEGWIFNSLWIDGHRRQRARSPNYGYFRVAQTFPGDQAKVSFGFHPGDIQPWSHLSDVIVTVYHAWETSIHRIASVNSDRAVVTFTGPAFWDFGKWDKDGQRYRVENTPEALDAPGEWYMDARQGTISYIPFPGEDFAQADVIAPVVNQLVILQGRPEKSEFIEHLQFRNLRLEHSDFAISPQGHSDHQAAVTVAGAIHARGIRHCVFEGLEMAHLGTYAISLTAGSQRNIIAGGLFEDLGAGGIKIGEARRPASPELSAAHNLVYNNLIRDGGRVFAGAVGVWVGHSSHNRIAHNEIAALDYTGISVGWTWGYEQSTADYNVIEYNYIHDIGRGVLSDLGGIYTLGMSPGTIIRRNVIHDVTSYLPTTIPACGIYLDEGSSYITVQSNLVYRTRGPSACQHYGKYNRLTNNILAFSGTGAIARYKEDGRFSFEADHNIIYGTRPFLEGEWNNRLFALDHNLYWDGSPAMDDRDRLALSLWRNKGNDIHSQLVDPGFVDPVAGDFRLSAGSPALRLGFLPFDLAAGRLRPASCDRVMSPLPHGYPRECPL